MKVIGTTMGGYILEATKTEVARVCGLYSEYDDQFKSPKIGDSIEVSAMYQKLRNIQQMRAKIVEAQEKLRQAANDLDPVLPIIERAASQEVVEY